MRVCGVDGDDCPRVERRAADQRRHRILGRQILKLRPICPAEAILEEITKQVQAMALPSTWDAK